MEKAFSYLFVIFLLSGTINAQEFKTIKIGNQVWMASNFSQKVPGSSSYNEDPAMEAKYGRLYTWQAALNACPKGWHLPSLKEWDELLTVLGGEDKAAKSLKVGGASGFNAKLGGMTGVGNYRLLNSYGAFWTSTPEGTDNAWFYYITADDNAVTSTFSVKTHGLSVRYIKNYK